MADEIIIEELELRCRIGITEEERANGQRLTVSLTLVPERGFAGLGDDIQNAVDYAKVAEEVTRVAESHPRALVETLGEDIATAVLTGFAVRSVELHLRKYVLPETVSVGIRLRRERA